MGFSRQEYWSELLLPLPGDLPNPGIKLTSPASPALQVDSLLLTIVSTIVNTDYSLPESSWILYWILNCKILVEKIFIAGIQYIEK